MINLLKEFTGFDREENKVQCLTFSWSQRRERLYKWLLHTFERIIYDFTPSQV